MIAQSLFAAFAAVLVVSSLLVVFHKNPVTSALFLVSGFCALAAIYLVLHAEFLGMVQVIVYAGAIMVLFLFVIMYLNLKTDIEAGVQVAVRRGLGLIVGGVLIAEAGVFIARRWSLGPASPPEAVPAVGNTQAVGQVLYSRYLFPFEITSMVLLVAMVGAIMISKPRRGDDDAAAAPAPAASDAQTPAAARGPAEPGASSPVAAGPSNPELHA